MAWTLRNPDQIFHVYDRDGNDITDTRKWLIDAEGMLFYLTDDIDSPLMEADEDYWIGD